MIVCCGEALIDFLPRKSAEGASVYQPFAGGGVFNTAIALGRLGLKTGFYSGLSTDFFGDMLREGLKASKVDLRYVKTWDKPSTLAFVKLTDGHARYSFFDDNSASRMLTKKDLPKLDKAVKALHFGSISLIPEPGGSTIEALVARNEIEVPPSMVKQQEQAMVYEFAQFLQYAGGMGQNGLPENFFDDLKERAAKRVRGGLLLSAIARLQNVAVEKADVDAKLAEIAEKSGKHVAKVRAEYSGEKLDQLENEILNDKLLSLLESKAKVKKGKRPEPEKSAASAESEPA